ncbi:hypothetical protein MtrunA17_Chr7g0229691 [Medicago truncatula]|uniref:Uncharacterized protein n=1 Tax=Medicago truncatula TaxID=3880 RepID=A0A396GYN9_MEDTR|nr:hypothetical protein MtrunA17_Chr7g0229691 [Medicago truncatula]
MLEVILWRDHRNKNIIAQKIISNYNKTKNINKIPKIKSDLCGGGEVGTVLVGDMWCTGLP